MNTYDPGLYSEHKKNVNRSKTIVLYTTFFYVYWTVHHLDSRIKIDHLMSLALFFAQHVSNNSTFNFRSLRLCVWVYCSGSMCVGVTVWFGWGDVVSLCRLRH